MVPSEQLKKLLLGRDRSRVQVCTPYKTGEAIDSLSPRERVRVRDTRTEDPKGAPQAGTRALTPALSRGEREEGLPRVERRPTWSLASS
jgi:hypothetical protein